MDLAPSQMDRETVEAFALCAGDLACTAQMLGTSKRIAEARVLRICRKASLGFRERRDWSAIPAKLETWLKEALECLALIAKYKAERNT